MDGKASYRPRFMIMRILISVWNKGTHTQVGYPISPWGIPRSFMEERGDIGLSNVAVNAIKAFTASTNPVLGADEKSAKPAITVVVVQPGFSQWTTSPEPVPSALTSLYTMTIYAHTLRVHA